MLNLRPLTHDLIRVKYKRIVKFKIYLSWRSANSFLSFLLNRHFLKKIKGYKMLNLRPLTHDLIRVKYKRVVKC